jgi:8-oxo-dGTP diphosphatase
MRSVVDTLVKSIDPYDELEATARTDVLKWIDSGVELCRTAKPDTPPKHLVSYLVLIDNNSVLLVDHRNAQLWLPTGGHVEPGEHPLNTAQREAHEELGIEPEFLYPDPLLLTCSTTGGLSAGHTDVSLWFVVRGDRSKSYFFDRQEFKEIRWFAFNDIPHSRTDPHLKRFLDKMTYRRSYD